MRRKPDEHRRARELRATGLPLGAIAAAVGASKSTVSLWVRDVALPPSAPYWRTAGTRSRIARPEEARPVVRLRVWRSGHAQRCSGCALLLPLESFNRLGERRQYYCRTCFRAYHREHGEAQRRLGKAAAEVRRRRAREHVIAILRLRDCTDCGEEDSLVLEFDHIGPKRANLADMVAAGRSIAAIDDELAHCEVVCVNCHRRRTARRAGWRRDDVDWPGRLVDKPAALRRSVTYAYDHLQRSGCVDCGITTLTVLDFDHVDQKRFSVMSGAWQGRPFSDIEREIASCVVRCGNCHRRRTATRAGYYKAFALSDEP